MGVPMAETGVNIPVPVENKKAPISRAKEAVKGAINTKGNIITKARAAFFAFRGTQPNANPESAIQSLAEGKAVVEVVSPVNPAPETPDISSPVTPVDAEVNSSPEVEIRTGMEVVPANIDNSQNTKDSSQYSQESSQETQYTPEQKAIVESIMYMAIAPGASLNGDELVRLAELTKQNLANLVNASQEDRQGMYEDLIRQAKTQQTQQSSAPTAPSTQSSSSFSPSVSAEAAVNTNPALPTPDAATVATPSADTIPPDVPVDTPPAPNTPLSPEVKVQLEKRLQEILSNLYNVNIDKSEDSLVKLRSELLQLAGALNFAPEKTQGQIDGMLRMAAGVSREEVNKVMQSPDYKPDVAKSILALENRLLDTKTKGELRDHVPAIARQMQEFFGEQNLDTDQQVAMQDVLNNLAMHLNTGKSKIGSILKLIFDALVGTLVGTGTKLPQAIRQQAR